MVEESLTVITCPTSLKVAAPLCKDLPLVKLWEHDPQIAEGRSVEIVQGMGLDFKNGWYRAFKYSIIFAHPVDLPA